MSESRPMTSPSCDGAVSTPLRPADDDISTGNSYQRQQQQQQPTKHRKKLTQQHIQSSNNSLTAAVLRASIEDFRTELVRNIILPRLSPWVPERVTCKVFGDDWGELWYFQGVHISLDLEPILFFSATSKIKLVALNLQTSACNQQISIIRQVTLQKTFV